MTRRPRFRRAAEPPAFRLTDDDVTMIRLLARHRFLRSTHIAALVGRSIDRTNDRLSKLFHAGYVDRPRAQLDHYPSSGSAPMIYALAGRGARLIAGRAEGEWERKNENVGRPFIEHQLEVMDFYVSLQLAVRNRPDPRLILPEELAASFPVLVSGRKNPFALRVQLSQDGIAHDIGLVPDLAFGLRFPDGSRRCFMVEIDRGTMPVTRGDIRQTSVERKMCSYLTAHAARQHERHFGWKTFRVLTVTTDNARMQSMKEALRRLHVPHSPGAPLFFFATRPDLSGADLLQDDWQDGSGRKVRLV